MCVYTYIYIYLFIYLLTDVYINMYTYTYLENRDMQYVYTYHDHISTDSKQQTQAIQFSSPASIFLSPALSMRAGVGGRLRRLLRPRGGLSGGAGFSGVFLF